MACSMQNPRIRGFVYYSYFLKSPLKNILELFRTGLLNTTKLNSQCYTFKRHFNEKNVFIDLDKLHKRERKRNDDILLDEFLNECGIFEKNVLLGPKKIKKLILSFNSKMLKERNLIEKEINIVERFLSFLEPFPCTLSNVVYDQMETMRVTEIREKIEKEYLAWKLNVDIRVMHRIYKLYRTFLMPGRSFRSLMYHFQMINEDSKVKFESVANKMYILFQKPYTNIHIKHFRSNIFGSAWDDVGIIYPNIIRLPYPILILLLDYLDYLGYTNTQIQNGLNCCKGNFKNLFGKISHVKNNSQFSAFKDHDKFLTLIELNGKHTENSSKLTQEEIYDFLENSPIKWLCLESRKVTMLELYYQLQKRIKLKDSSFENLYKHPKITSASFGSILSTLNYLRKHFTEDEIMESLPIILYPKYRIKNCISDIYNNNIELIKVGYKNGYVSKETHHFSVGTIKKNKTLQLCLYYLEKPYNFTGSGILVGNK